MVKAFKLPTDLELQMFTEVIKLILLKVEAETDLSTVVELPVARILTTGCVLLEKAVLGDFQ